MTPVDGLFEGHVTVRDLECSRVFYRDLLGLEEASVFPERKVAFYWLGGRGNAMLGVWEVGGTPQRMSTHLAFRVKLEDLLLAPEMLRQAGVTPMDVAGKPLTEPVVLSWMPAAAVYFEDPDGNLLEYLSMLPDEPRPDLGALSWSAWLVRR